jgi:hypothetical protein
MVVLQRVVGVEICKAFDVNVINRIGRGDTGLDVGRLVINIEEGVLG